MSEEDARRAIEDSLVAVAPDVAGTLTDLDQDEDLFEVLDLDSMDHLNTMVQLLERTGVEVPEREYGRLRTLAALTQYLSSAVG